MGKFSRREIDDIFFFLFFPENWIWQFMQIVSCAWSVKSCFFWKNKKKKIFQNIICWNFYPACKVLKELSQHKTDQKKRKKQQQQQKKTNKLQGYFFWKATRCMFHQKYNSIHVSQLAFFINV